MYVALGRGKIGRWTSRAGQTGERSAAALAVENERLQSELRDRLSAEAALRRVATLVAQEHAPEEVFALVRFLTGNARLAAAFASVVRFRFWWRWPEAVELMSQALTAPATAS
jgi:hypothetical protein